MAIESRDYSGNSYRNGGGKAVGTGRKVSKDAGSSSLSETYNALSNQLEGKSTYSKDFGSNTLVSPSRSEKQKSAKDMRDANAFEEMMIKSKARGDAVYDALGGRMLNEELTKKELGQSWNVGKAALGLLGSTAASSVTAAMETPAYLYEMGNGTKITDSDTYLDAEGNVHYSVSKDKMTAEQRLGSGAYAAINVAGTIPGVGGLFTAPKAAVSAGKRGAAAAKAASRTAKAAKAAKEAGSDFEKFKSFKDAYNVAKGEDKFLASQKAKSAIERNEFLDKDFRGKVRSIASDTIKDSMLEGAEEGVQTVFENMSGDRYGSNEDLLDGVGQAAVLGALGGAMLGGIGNTVRGVVWTKRGKAVMPGSGSNEVEVSEDNQITGTKILPEYIDYQKQELQKSQEGKTGIVYGTAIPGTIANGVYGTRIRMSTDVLRSALTATKASDEVGEDGDPIIEAPGAMGFLRSAGLMATTDKNGNSQPPKISGRTKAALDAMGVEFTDNGSVDPESFLYAMYANSDEANINLAELVNSVIDERGSISITVGKQPATNEGPFRNCNLVGIASGDGTIEVSPLLMHLLNGDFDGDTLFLGWNSDLYRISGSVWGRIHDFKNSNDRSRDNVSTSYIETSLAFPIMESGKIFEWLKHEMYTAVAGSYENLVEIDSDTGEKYGATKEEISIQDGAIQSKYVFDRSHIDGKAADRIDAFAEEIVKLCNDGVLDDDTKNSMMQAQYASIMDDIYNIALAKDIESSRNSKTERTVGSFSAESNENDNLMNGILSAIQLAGIRTAEIEYSFGNALSSFARFSKAFNPNEKDEANAALSRQERDLIKNELAKFKDEVAIDQYAYMQGLDINNNGEFIFNGDYNSLGNLGAADLMYKVSSLMMSGTITESDLLNKINSIFRYASWPVYSTKAEDRFSHYANALPSNVVKYIAGKMSMSNPGISTDEKAQNFMSKVMAEKAESAVHAISYARTEEEFCNALSSFAADYNSVADAFNETIGSHLVSSGMYEAEEGFTNVRTIKESIDLNGENESLIDAISRLAKYAPNAPLSSVFDIDAKSEYANLPLSILTEFGTHFGITDDGKMSEKIILSVSDNGDGRKIAKAVFRAAGKSISEKHRNNADLLRGRISGRTVVGRKEHGSLVQRMCDAAVSIDEKINDLKDEGKKNIDMRKDATAELSMLQEEFLYLMGELYELVGPEICAAIGAIDLNFHTEMLSIAKENDSVSRENKFVDLMIRNMFAYRLDGLFSHISVIINILNNENVDMARLNDELGMLMSEFSSLDSNTNPIYSSMHAIMLKPIKSIDAAIKSKEFNKENAIDACRAALTYAYKMIADGSETPASSVLTDKSNPFMSGFPERDRKYIAMSLLISKPDEDPSDVSMSKRVKKSAAKASNSIMFSLSAQIDAVDSIDQWGKSANVVNNEELKKETLIALINERAITAPSESMISNSIIAQLSNIERSVAEKAKASEEDQLLYEAAVASNGAVVETSFDKIMRIAGSGRPLTEIEWANDTMLHASLIYDTSVEFYVGDRKMNLYEAYKESGIQIKEGKEPTFDQMVAFLRSNPMLATLLLDTELVQTSINGVPALKMVAGEGNYDQTGKLSHIEALSDIAANIEGRGNDGSADYKSSREYKVVRNKVAQLAAKNGLIKPIAIAKVVGKSATEKDAVDYSNVSDVVNNVIDMLTDLVIAAMTKNDNEDTRAVIDRIVRKGFADDANRDFDIASRALFASLLKSWGNGKSVAVDFVNLSCDNVVDGLIGAIIEDAEKQIQSELIRVDENGKTEIKIKDNVDVNSIVETVTKKYLDVYVLYSSMAKMYGFDLGKKPFVIKAEDESILFKSEDINDLFLKAINSAFGEGTTGYVDIDSLVTASNEISKRAEKTKSDLNDFQNDPTRKRFPDSCSKILLKTDNKNKLMKLAYEVNTGKGHIENVEDFYSITEEFIRNELKDIGLDALQINSVVSNIIGKYKRSERFIHLANSNFFSYMRNEFNGSFQQEAAILEFQRGLYRDIEKSLLEIYVNKEIGRRSPSVANLLATDVFGLTDSISSSITDFTISAADEIRSDDRLTRLNLIPKQGFVTNSERIAEDSCKSYYGGWMKTKNAEFQMLMANDRLASGNIPLAVGANGILPQKYGFFNLLLGSKHECSTKQITSNSFDHNGRPKAGVQIIKNQGMVSEYGAFLKARGKKEGEIRRLLSSFDGKSLHTVRDLTQQDDFADWIATLDPDAKSQLIGYETECDSPYCSKHNRMMGNFIQSFFNYGEEAGILKIKKTYTGSVDIVNTDKTYMGVQTTVDDLNVSADAVIKNISDNRENFEKEIRTDPFFKELDSLSYVKPFCELLTPFVRVVINRNGERYETYVSTTAITDGYNAFVSSNHGKPATVNDCLAAYNNKFGGEILLYDNNGNVVTETDANGNVVNVTMFDPENHFVLVQSEVTHPDIMADYYARELSLIYPSSDLTMNPSDVVFNAMIDCGRRSGGKSMQSLLNTCPKVYGSAKKASFDIDLFGASQRFLIKMGLQKDARDDLFGGGRSFVVGSNPPKVSNIASMILFKELAGKSKAKIGPTRYRHDLVSNGISYVVSDRRDNDEGFFAELSSAFNRLDSMQGSSSNLTSNYKEGNLIPGTTVLIDTTIHDRTEDVRNLLTSVIEHNSNANKSDKIEVALSDRALGNEEVMGMLKDLGIDKNDLKKIGKYNYTLDISVMFDAMVGNAFYDVPSVPYSHNRFTANNGMIFLYGTTKVSPMDSNGSGDSLIRLFNFSNTFENTYMMEVNLDGIPVKSKKSLRVISSDTIDKVRDNDDVVIDKSSNNDNLIDGKTFISAWDGRNVAYGSDGQPMSVSKGAGTALITAVEYEGEDGKTHVVPIFADGNSSIFEANPKLSGEKLSIMCQTEIMFDEDNKVAMKMYSGMVASKGEAQVQKLNFTYNNGISSPAGILDSLGAFSRIAGPTATFVKKQTILGILVEQTEQYSVLFDSNGNLRDINSVLSIDGRPITDKAIVNAWNDLGHATNKYNASFEFIHSILPYCDGRIAFKNVEKDVSNTIIDFMINAQQHKVPVYWLLSGASFCNKHKKQRFRLDAITGFQTLMGEAFDENAIRMIASGLWSIGNHGNSSVEWCKYGQDLIGNGNGKNCVFQNDGTIGYGWNLADENGGVYVGQNVAFIQMSVGALPTGSTTGSGSSSVNLPLILSGTLREPYKMYGENNSLQDLVAASFLTSNGYPSSSDKINFINSITRSSIEKTLEVYDKRKKSRSSSKSKKPNRGSFIDYDGVIKFGFAVSDYEYNFNVFRNAYNDILNNPSKLKFTDHYTTEANELTGKEQVLDRLRAVHKRYFGENAPFNEGFWLRAIITHLGYTPSINGEFDVAIDTNKALNLINTWVDGSEITPFSYNSTTRNDEGRYSIAYATQADIQYANKYYKGDMESIKDNMYSLESETRNALLSDCFAYLSEEWNSKPNSKDQLYVLLFAVNTAMSNNNMDVSWSIKNRLTLTEYNNKVRLLLDVMLGKKRIDDVESLLGDGYGPHDYSVDMGVQLKLEHEMREEHRRKSHTHKRGLLRKNDRNTRVQDSSAREAFHKVESTLDMGMKTTGLLSPQLMLDSAVDGAILRTEQSATMFVQKKLTMSKKSRDLANSIDSEAIKEFASSKDNREFVNLCKLAKREKVWDKVVAYYSQDPARIAYITIDSFRKVVVSEIDNMHGVVTDEKNLLDRANQLISGMYSWVAKVFTLSEWQSERRTRNWANAFIIDLAETNQNSSLFDNVVNQVDGKTVVEPQLSAAMRNGGGLNLLASVMLNDRNAESVSAARASNVIAGPEYAEDNFLTYVFDAICSSSPTFRLLLSGAGMKFPKASINFLAQHAPLSRTFNYIIGEVLKDGLNWNEIADNKGNGANWKSWNMSLTEIRRRQVYSSLFNALVADCLSLSVPVIAGIIFAQFGAMEPPEDKDKWCNIEEWTLFGFRIGQSWWMKEILGTPLAVAAFWTSCAMGEPCFSVILTTTVGIVENNPYFNISEYVKGIVEPEISLDEMGYVIDEYTEDTGVGILEYLATRSATFCVSGLSCLFTPSFLRSYSRYTSDTEKSTSYRYTDDGRVEKIDDWSEVQWRKLTRNNVALANIFNALHIGGEDDWRWDQMPDVKYYDDDQITFMKATSLTDEDGNRKSPSEVQSICAATVMILMENDDMDALYHKGFFLSSETKYAVGQYIWDMVHAEQLRWEEAQSNGSLNYEVLGDGDWNAGKELYYQLKMSHDAVIDNLNSLYYDKLNSYDLNQGLQSYTMDNTTWLKDANGDWYATGFLESNASLISPIFITEPDSDNAGRSEDWRSVSAVTGRTLRSRALNPDDLENNRLDQRLEDFADNSNDGYSSNAGTGWNVSTSTFAPTTTISQAMSDTTDAESDAIIESMLGMSRLDIQNMKDELNEASSGSDVKAIEDETSLSSSTISDLYGIGDSALGMLSSFYNSAVGSDFDLSDYTGGSDAGSSSSDWNDYWSSVLSGDGNDNGYVNGGYRRSGGSGGSGGGSSKIYSNPQSVYADNATTMRSSRIYGADYDYLRPSVTTQGSRKAYTRTDN